MVSIMITTLMARARCGRMMKKNIENGPEPSIRAASFCSLSSDWMAVSRIRRAKGVHCQATMMTIEANGKLPKKSMAGKPSPRAMLANSPFTGCISMFFQIRALTVGMTKKGAMAKRRATPRP
jgi:hypothetical protein